MVARTPAVKKALKKLTGGGGTIDINQSGVKDQTVDLNIDGDSFDIDITQSD